MLILDDVVATAVGEGANGVVIGSDAVADATGFVEDAGARVIRCVEDRRSGPTCRRVWGRNGPRDVYAWAHEASRGRASCVRRRPAPGCCWRRLPRALIGTFYRYGLMPHRVNLTARLGGGAGCRADLLGYPGDDVAIDLAISKGGSVLVCGSAPATMATSTRCFFA